MGLTPWFGNVILGVVDLAATAERLRAIGLDVREGGTHPQFGTRNMVVPLGRSYLELLTVDDPTLAEQSLFGRTLLARTADGDRLVRWSIRTDRIDDVAAELGLEVDDRSRLHPDGRTLRWRSAGMTPSLLDPADRSSCSGLTRTGPGPNRPDMRPRWVRSSAWSCPGPTVAISSVGRSASTSRSWSPTDHRTWWR